MKKKISLFLLLLSWSISFSQDPGLFENEWFLHELAINDESFIPPSNAELESVPLNFSPQGDRFETYVCAALAGEPILFSSSENSFLVEKFYVTIVECGIPDNSDFTSTYFIDFFSWQEADKTFYYEIIEDGEDRTLILTNENGDLAIYGNEPPLDTDTFPLSSIQIYPNPTSDFLFVKAQSGLLDYQLFDLNGRLVTEQQPSGAETRVDLSELPAALYFLRLQSEEGTRTYKILKK